LIATSRWSLIVVRFDQALGDVMKLFAFSAGALSALVLACAAGAQTTQSEPAPSPAALEHARHVIQAMHAEKLYDQMISAVESSVISSMAKNAPADKQQYVQTFERAYLEEMRAMMPKLTDQMAVIYATDFTEQQLTDIDAFYASPTGQAVLAKMPRMGQQLIPYMLAQMPMALSRAFDKTCQMTACTAEQRAAMAKAIDAMKARAGAAQPG
jgi:hypothetical protein